MREENAANMGCYTELLSRRVIVVVSRGRWHDVKQLGRGGHLGLLAQDVNQSLLQPTIPAAALTTSTYEI